MVLSPEQTNKYTYKGFNRLKDNIETPELIHVQTNSFDWLLTQGLKELFEEISQKEVVIQASQRQKHLDQGQSLNLMIPPKASPKEASELLIFGWEQGLKGFYYQRRANPSQELARSIMNCSSCEG